MSDSMDNQRTLAAPVELEGVGLFFGEPVRVTCRPAPPGTGVTFIRTDLPGRPEIAATILNAMAPQRWTALRSGGAEVFMVEHLLAAAAGLTIDNLIVETTAKEMPVADGSAKTYTDLFLKAGLIEQDAPVSCMEIGSPLAVNQGDALLAALPQERGLTVTYVLDYGEQFVGTQSCTFTVDRDTFVRDIAPARTYVLRPEVDAFLQQGLGRGATPENTVVLEENGEAGSPLRFPNECARHKALDLIGDLFLAGGRLCARVLGYKSGHITNVKLATALAEMRQAAGSSRTG